MKKKKLIPLKPRIPMSLRMAREFIRDAGIFWLPINIKELYDLFGWAIYSCSEAEDISGKNDPFSIRKDDVDAKTYLRDDGIYVTIYDENVLPERIRWTLAHEIGHIVLNHLLDFDETCISRGGLNSGKYRTLEREADTFAAELLAPMTILKTVGAYEIEEIIYICNISRGAAENRKRDIAWHGYKYVYCEGDVFLRFQFRLYLTLMAVCTKTDYANIPPIESMIKKNLEVKAMDKKFAFIKTDKKGRFIQCPKCGNEFFSKNAKYCKMCGNYLYNECTNEGNYSSFDDGCGRRHFGDARYCEYCGAPTRIFEMGLLMSWEEVIKTYGNIAAGIDPDEWEE